MTIADIVAARLTSQRLAQPDFLEPADVVRWFGAVQAQDFRSALYAISLRMAPAVTESQVEQAVNDRAIVRSWPMRGTLHLMAAEDARWMINLLGPRLDAKAAGNYRRAGLSADVLARAGEVLTQELQGGSLRTRPELYAALAAAGVEAGMQNGQQRGSHILGYWARHGLVCIAERRGKQQTFALLDEWLPPGRSLTGDAALAELALRYFTSHGPATRKDFMWWSGLTSGEAARGIQKNQSALEQATAEGNVYWFAAGRSHFHIDNQQVWLLPAYDEYTVAYADRGAVIEPALLSKMGYGIGANVIVAGRLAGTWKPTTSKDSTTIAVQIVSPLNKVQTNNLGDAVKRYGAYLQTKTVLAA